MLLSDKFLLRYRFTSWVRNNPHVMVQVLEALVQTASKVSNLEQSKSSFAGIVRHYLAGSV